MSRGKESERIRQRVEKKCTTCKIIKPLSEFYRNKRRLDGRTAFCKVCSKKENRTRYLRSPEKKKQYYLKTAYGMLLSEYQSLLNVQKGRCAACGQLPTRRGLVVDHDHKTGKVRSLLCGNCNSALGYLGDDPIRVNLLLQYILNYEDDKLNASG